MVFAEDIRRVILELAEERGTKHTFASDEVARAVDKKNWRVLTEQVKLVASILVKEGKIVAVGPETGVSAFRKI
jgi:imidazolonepropionase-like amidohydrolase